jgi:hypothetical protein
MPNTASMHSALLPVDFATFMFLFLLPNVRDGYRLPSILPDTWRIRRMSSCSRSRSAKIFFLRCQRFQVHQRSFSLNVTVGGAALPAGWR